jgi:hypothetical protein
MNKYLEFSYKGYTFVLTKTNTMTKQEFDNLTEDELIELVESITRYQTNRGWIIAISIGVGLFLLHYFKIFI